MDRKLSSIDASIQARSGEFNDHLKNKLPPQVLEFVNKLQSRTEVYLFSGLIRDFFLKASYELRDVDFIISDDLDIKRLFPRLKIARNSFNGYKATIGSLPVDLWGLQNTWALNQGQLNFPFRRLESLPDTTFFNFSSIVFLLNEQRFVVGKPFLRFMRDKVLDIVLEENPLPSLCIINSIYYSEKYKLKLSPQLRKYILSHYADQTEVFEKIQVSHFNKILYSGRNLKNKIREIRRLEALKKSVKEAEKLSKSDSPGPLFS